LVIDQARGDLTSASTRRSLISACENIHSLDWKYNCANGGFGSASATVKVERGSWGRSQVDGRNYSTAFIYYAPPEIELNTRGTSGSSADNDPTLMTEYDAYESQWLLWSGLVVDSDTDTKSDLVTFNMMGLGDFVGKVFADRSGYDPPIKSVYDWAVLNAGAISQTSWVVTDPIASGDKRILNDGAMLREVLYQEGRAPTASHMNNLTEMLGGHPRVAWGISNAGGADDYGQVYFSMICDPAREQTSSDSEFNDRTCPYISPLEVTSLRTSDDTSEVINACRVFKPWDGIESGNIIRDGYAENTTSINRVGKREAIISDSSVQNSSQASDRAAEFVAANSSPEVLVEAEILHDPRPVSAPNAGGDTYLPLFQALKDGTVSIPLPFEERSDQERLNNGDATLSIFEPSDSDAIVLEQDASNAACVAVDCRSGAPSKSVPNAPNGLYSASPYFYDGGDFDGQALLYHYNAVWTDDSELGDGAGALNSVALCEWDRQFYLVLEAQGTTPQTYKPYMAYRTAAGAWAALGTGADNGFSIYTGSVLQKSHLTSGLSFTISWSASAFQGSTGDTKAGTMYLRIYNTSNAKRDPSGVDSLLWSGTNPHVSAACASGVMSTAGARVFLPNKASGTGATPHAGASDYPTLSKSVNICALTAWANDQENNTTVMLFNGDTVNDFADDVVWQSPLYKHQNLIVLDTVIPCWRAKEVTDVTSTDCTDLFWQAYRNTGSFTDGGLFSQVVSGTAGTGVEEYTKITVRKDNSWLIGTGSTNYRSALGPDLSLAVREASCSLQGSKIRLRLTGNARPLSATYRIEEASKELDEVLRNQMTGE